MQNETEREYALRNLRMTLIVLTAVAVAGVGVCYLYFWLAPRYPILAPGCIMSRLLHLYCPGCGGTRAVAALLRGDLLTSLRANPLVLWGGILAVMQYVRVVRALVRRDPFACTIPTWSWVSVIVLALGLFVVRNLLLVFAGYDYLGDNRAFWADRLP